MLPTPRDRIPHRVVEPLFRLCSELSSFSGGIRPRLPATTAGFIVSHTGADLWFIGPAWACYNHTRNSPIFYYVSVGLSRERKWRARHIWPATCSTLDVYLLKKRKDAALVRRLQVNISRSYHYFGKCDAKGGVSDYRRIICCARPSLELAGQSAELSEMTRPIVHQGLPTTSCWYRSEEPLGTNRTILASLSVYERGN